MKHVLFIHKLYIVFTYIQ